MFRSRSVLIHVVLELPRAVLSNGGQQDHILPPKMIYRTPISKSQGRICSCIGGIQIDAVDDFVWALVATLRAAGLLSITNI